MALIFGGTAVSAQALPAINSGIEFPTNVCAGNYGAWVQAYTGGAQEDNPATFNGAYATAGWTLDGDALPFRTDTPVIDPNTPDLLSPFDVNPTGQATGAVAPNAPLTGITLENDTNFVDTALTIYRINARPGDAFTTTSFDSGFLEHNTLAALDEQGNLISNVIRIDDFPLSSTQTLNIGAVPASGVFFIYSWRVDLEQGGASFNANCGADLVTTKTIPNGVTVYDDGDTVTFQIEVDNLGRQLAQDVSLTDLIPDGFDAATIAATPSQGTYDASTGLWTIGDIDIDETVTLTIAAEIERSAADTEIVNVTTAAVSAFQPDLNDGGNTGTPVEDTLSAAIVVRPSDDPVAEDDTFADVTPGVPNTFDILGNDGDPNGTLDATSVLLTTTGLPATVTLSDDGRTLVVPDEGTWTVESDGQLTFTPVEGFFGSPTPVKYTVEDNDGNLSNEATVTLQAFPSVEILATDDSPVFVNGQDGETTDFSVLDNDTLGGDTISDPSLVSVTLVSLEAPEAGSISIGPDGTIAVAAGTTAGTFLLVYEICEATNTTNCATAEVELTVVEGELDLIAEIEEDLEAILEEDLANTLTQQSNRISGYAADALDRLRRQRAPNTCLAEVNAHLAAENILFDTDKAIIKPESDATLDQIASILSSCAGSAFEIAGHTDSDASAAYNLDLSQRRAAAVLVALSNRGVDAAGFVARGYGESAPIASNATAAGKRQNRRVEFRAIDIAGDIYPERCNDDFHLMRNFSARANQDGVDADGDFLSDSYDCSTGRRDVYEGSIGFIDTDAGQTQRSINLSYRREYYRGSESVFGYFGGLYGSYSDVTRLADGDVRGYGFNGGVYGANRLQNALFVDYYLGAAVGRHNFDLDFERDIGRIETSGDYTYVAGFVGAALSGDLDMGNAKLTPRVGFDYVYTPGANVDVNADLGNLSQFGSVDIDSISGGRLFAEIRTEHMIGEGDAMFYVTPRASCYQSLGALDGVCGFGGSIGIVTTAIDTGLTYAFEVDAEFGEDYRIGSLSISLARQFGLGSLTGDAGVGSEGDMTISGGYEVNF